jgi:hypothetical protein
VTITHTPTREDFGGVITVVAESPAEIVEVAKHFRLLDTSKPEDVLKLAEMMAAGTYTHEVRSEKRPWYEVQVALDYPFTAPYLDGLAKLTGCDDLASNFPDMDLLDRYPHKLGHTHTVTAIALEGMHVVATVLITSEDWNGKKAAERAEPMAERYLAAEIGTTKHEPEFIANNNGTFSHNPNYLRQNKPEPGLGCSWLWDAMVSHWLEHRATDQQRDIIRRARELGSHTGSLELTGFPKSLPYGGFYYGDPAGTVNWDSKGTKVAHISFEAFAKLGAAR